MDTASTNNENNFRTWEFSLYKISQQSVPGIRLHKYGEDMYSDDANFSAAAVLLQNGNLEDAWQFITLSLRKNPDSVHAWCNKGVYHLKRNPPQLVETEEAESKMRQLLKQPEPRKTAIVEYAYWLHEMDRSDESRVTAFQLFEETLTNEEGDVKMEHHYSYLKVLTVKAKSVKNTGNRWLSTVLRNVVNECALLMSANDPRFELEVWRFLAEVQNNWHCVEIMEKNSQEFSKILQAAGVDKYDRNSCIDKMLEIKEKHPKIPIGTDFYVDIGRCYSFMAIDCSEYVPRWELLEKALEFAERYLDTSRPRCSVGPKICSKILLYMWSMKYLPLHQDMVKSEFSKIRPGTTSSQDKLWKFLAEEFYTTNADQSTETRPLLEQAKDHLQRCINDNSDNFLPSWAMVKLLLGEPVEEVEQAFPLATKFPSDKHRVMLLANRGRFLETIGKYGDAMKSYRAAETLHLQTECHKTSYYIAKFGITRCAKILA